MPWKTVGQLKWLEFKIFSGNKIKHGVFTRSGGVSGNPYQSLNLGGTVGDSKEHVIENKRRLLSALEIDFESTYDGWQVHSTDYIRVNAPRPAGQPHQKADILVTDVPGVTLMMRFADCVPIMVYDPIRHVVGIAHAGWKGTTMDVAGHLVRALEIEFGSKPADLLAGIGPSICQEHYEVGMEVAEATSQVLGMETDTVVSYKDDKPHLDLWKTNQLLLNHAGVKHIEVAQNCTVCHNDDWFSHRAEKGHTGRFGAVIQLL